MSAQQPRPLISIPSGKTDDGIDRAAFELYVEFARQVSTCWACSSPIPRGSTRFSVVLKLDLLAHPPKLTDSGGRPRRTMRYNFHTGCLARPVGQEIRRDWNSCFDCGMLPPGRVATVSCTDDTGAVVGQLAEGRMHWHGRCFTGSRSTVAVLCDTCQEKPHWEVCLFCTVFFPGWLISDVVSSASNPDINLEVVDRIRACQFCCDKLGLTRREDADEHAREFQELREQIQRDGVWSG